MGEVRRYLVGCDCNSKWSGGGQTGGDVLKRIYLKKEKKKYSISWKSNRHCSCFVIVSAGKYMEGPNGNCGIGKHQGLTLGLGSTYWCELVENRDWNPLLQDAGLWGRRWLEAAAMAKRQFEEAEMRLLWFSLGVTIKNNMRNERIRRTLGRPKRRYLDVLCYEVTNYYDGCNFGSI